MRDSMYLKFNGSVSEMFDAGKCVEYMLWIHFVSIICRIWKHMIQLIHGIIIGVLLDEYDIHTLAGM